MAFATAPFGAKRGPVWKTGTYKQEAEEEVEAAAVAAEGSAAVEFAVEFVVAASECLVVLH